MFLALLIYNDFNCFSFSVFQQRKLYEIEKQLKHVFSVSSGFTEKNSELISINKTLEQRICSLVEQNNALVSNSRPNIVLYCPGLFRLSKFSIL